MGKFKKTTVLVFALVVVLASTSLRPRIGLAGAGSVEKNGDRHLLTLNVMFAYPETDLGSGGKWQALFQQASDLLFNATEGQVAIGKINLFGCGHAKDLADIWVENSAQLPNVPTANLSGMGSKGQHITIFKDQLQKGPFGVVHELGHYVFGLYDEYRGQHRQNSCNGTPVETNWPASGDFYCTAPTSGKACIMGASGLESSTRTEFCTDPSDNFPGTKHTLCQSAGGQFTQNAQEAIKKEACWVTLTKYGLKKPTREPSSTLPPSPPKVEFVQVMDLSRLILVIDRSGSMAAQQKMEMAQLGAKIFVDLLRPKSDLSLHGDELAIVSFSNSTSVDFRLQEIASETIRNQARQGINSLSANGSTALFDGVQAALDILRPGGSSKPASGCGEAIILLSDGVENASSHKLDEVITNLQNAEGVRLYSIGLGEPELVGDKCTPSADGVCTSTLQSLAVRGFFRRARSASELQGIFTELSRSVRDEGLLIQLAKNVKKGATDSTVVIVESGSNEATFSVSWQGSATLDVTLTDPNGNTLTPSKAAADPNSQFFSGENVQYYRVKQPLSGRWLINTRLVGGPDQLDFIAQATSDISHVNVVATMSQDEYFFPQQMKIRTQVDAGFPVAGATVTGRVRRPDGSIVNLTLFDDGKSEHGDAFADDGVYSGLFTNYVGNGTYSFDVTVRNETGRTIADLPFIESDVSGSTPSMQVGPFVRQTTVTAILKDQPNFDVICRDPKTMNTLEYDFVKGDCSFDLIGTFVFTTSSGEKFVGSAINIPVIVTRLNITMAIVGLPPNSLTNSTFPVPQITVSPLGAACNVALRTSDGRRFVLNGTGRWDCK